MLIIFTLYRKALAQRDISKTQIIMSSTRIIIKPDPDVSLCPHLSCCQFPFDADELRRNIEDASILQVVAPPTLGAIVIVMGRPPFFF